MEKPVIPRKESAKIGAKGNAANRALALTWLLKMLASDLTTVHNAAPLVKKLLKGERFTNKLTKAQLKAGRPRLLACRYCCPGAGHAVV